MIVLLSCSGRTQVGFLFCFCFFFWVVSLGFVHFFWNGCEQSMWRFVLQGIFRFAGAFVCVQRSDVKIQTRVNVVNLDRYKWAMQFCSGLELWRFASFTPIRLVFFSGFPCFLLCSQILSLFFFARGWVSGVSRHFLLRSCGEGAQSWRQMQMFTSESSWPQSIMIYFTLTLRISYLLVANMSGEGHFQPTDGLCPIINRAWRETTRF